MIGLVIDSKRAARPGMKLVHAGKEIGVVTSGCPSPTLGDKLCEGSGGGGTIAMGFVPTELSTPGTPIEVDTGKGTLTGKIVPLPFYKVQKAT